MPVKQVAKFSVNYLQVMNEKGEVDKKLMPKLSEEEILRIYRLMVLGRKLDDKMLTLQRQGRIATFASIRGQEASTVASAFALRKEDWMVCSFRENASYITRGLPPEKLLLFYGGSEEGSKIPDGENDLPTAIPVGTQVLHGAGIAWALKIQKKKAVVLTYFGDGATSEGDFHEGMNFAGVFNVPVVMLCQNNQWAISIPRKKQTHAETLAQKSIAYGFEGIQVDGNDAFAVYKATKEALDNARNGKGPVMIESLTYRMGDHTTADDANRYRDPREVSLWQKRDPIARLKLYLLKQKLWSEQQERELMKEVDALVEEAVDKYEHTPIQPIESIFKYTYKEMIPELKEQLDELKYFVEKKESANES